MRRPGAGPIARTTIGMIVHGVLSSHEIEWAVNERNKFGSWAAQVLGRAPMSQRRGSGYSGMFLCRPRRAGA